MMLFKNAKYRTEIKWVNIISNFAYKSTVLRKLYQGHLHPKIEVPGLTCPGRDASEHFRKD
jgi:hypothetical protein